jgi:hypothetical protein
MHSAGIKIFNNFLQMLCKGDLRLGMLNWLGLYLVMRRKNKAKGPEVVRSSGSNISACSVCGTATAVQPHFDAAADAYFPLPILVSSQIGQR